MIGRKNCCSVKALKGVNASAYLYFLIETVKANRLEPHAHLRILFKELPKAITIDEIEGLLPGNINLTLFKLS